MQMRQFDDPDVAVSIVAILFFIGAAFVILALLGSLLSGDLFTLIRFGVAVAQVVAGAGLLKVKRWAWPLGVGAAGVSALIGLLLVVLGALIAGLSDVFFAGLALYLLFRPAVRERFTGRPSSGW